MSDPNAKRPHEGGRVAVLIGFGIYLAIRGRADRKQGHLAVQANCHACVIRDFRACDTDGGQLAIIHTV